jgi:hypothetical protein
MWICWQVGVDVVPASIRWKSAPIMTGAVGGADLPLRRATP